MVKLLPSEKRTRKRHRFIGFIVFPVHLPHQAKVISLIMSLAIGTEPNLPRFRERNLFHFRSGVAGPSHWIPVRMYLLSTPHNSYCVITTTSQIVLRLVCYVLAASKFGLPSSYCYLYYSISQNGQILLFCDSQIVTNHKTRYYVRIMMSQLLRSYVVAFVNSIFSEKAI